MEEKEKVEIDRKVSHGVLYQIDFWLPSFSEFVPRRRRRHRDRPPRDIFSRFRPT
jgi:hypothetical protein